MPIPATYFAHSDPRVCPAAAEAAARIAYCASIDPVVEPDVDIAYYAAEVADAENAYVAQSEKLLALIRECGE